MRVVVPKPGIVTAMMFSGGRPFIRNASAAMMSARVESNPPLMPSTRWLQWILRRR